MRQSVALIGLSGTGKSTVAQLLGEQQGWPVYDIDALVVAQTGRAVAELFASEGEAVFRQYETAALQTVLTTDRQLAVVIATGGGIVLRDANRQLLREHTRVIWLDAPTAVLLARLQAATNETRPLLVGDDPVARIEAMRQARQTYYRELADYRLDTSGLSAAQVAASIGQWVTIENG